MDLSTVRADLLAEQQAVDDVVAALRDQQWDLPTASPRWSVADQIGHLRYFDRSAALAISDPVAFRQGLAELLSASANDDGAVDDLTLGKFRALSPAAKLAAWRRGRQTLAAAAARLEDSRRVDWYGPSMGAKSFLTARLMEVWAHGTDVCDAVGIDPQVSDRLRHVAQLGVITRTWSYRNRGLEPPRGKVRVELEAPSGATWTWGDSSAATPDAPGTPSSGISNAPGNAPAGTVSGTALDFCLVVTQRRNLADTDLEVTGELAREWLTIAQAFAGPATDPPAAVAGKAGTDAAGAAGWRRRHDHGEP